MPMRRMGVLPAIRAWVIDEITNEGHASGAVELSRVKRTHGVPAGENLGRTVAIAVRIGLNAVSIG